LVALAINGVIILHMAGGDRFSIPAPNPQSTPSHKYVHFLAKLHAKRGIGNLTFERRNALVILLMDCGSGQRPFHTATPLPIWLLFHYIRIREKNQ